ncbi:transmembrane protein 171 [Oxyura jamaicensis]|uniref:transmembrane protein 171 n=1 Tax=Oxyura jamaicensis TaxID=8884 RepID=UPI0015A67775|nr:transmembrane protein 171 [Oxyura jamaicensis]XP_035166680.1 transmembrane protein 171 [Oxyura jamaicensis]
MYPVAVPAPGSEANNGQHEKLTFFFFVFGAFFLCAGFLLSVFILQSCPYETFSDCNGVLKASGPVLAVTGLVFVLLARSRARLYTRQRQLQNEQVYSLVFCRGSCQFAQFLIFGFLFLTSGMLISILGIWVPGCSPGWHTIQLNQTRSSDVNLQGCGFLSLQILGPLIVFTGLCFFLIAHVKKQNFSLSTESFENEECPQSPESFQVTVGDTVMVFPPPPPPYFSDPTVTHCLMSSGLPAHENPPPYQSIFSDRARLADDDRTVAAIDCEAICTTSGCSSSSDILPMLSLCSESPVEYEENISVTSNEYSLSSSSVSLVTLDTSS